MTTAATDSDVGFGLGLIFSLVAVLGALGMAYFGYASATGAGSGHAAQINAGIAFGIAVFAGALAVAAFHAYDR